ncbi:MAG: acetyl-CoA decarbonylase/synthase complex subunit delta [Candidatus Bipolaricaulota bacterium]|nr:MAG: acetyl-CoA decarbonylase/synthase complex subunit delta [Candidatus Bipolaricaulota bacterium]
MPDAKKSWPHTINELTIGATAETGGTRASTVVVGGETTLPFYHFEGSMPNAPVVAMEVWDIPPEDWPEPLQAPFADVMSEPGTWAAACVERHGAQMICLRLKGCDPNGANRSPDEAAAAAKRVADAVGVPLIVWGCGNDDKDNEVFPVVAEAMSGENCLLGTITEDNYKTLTAVGTAYGHKLIAESPVDINMAKQVNILALDVEYPAENLVIYPSTGALGYGIEYVYSIMERLRIAGLKGDKVVAMPMLCDIGVEVWGVKEAKAPEAEVPGWGDVATRGPMWEASTAVVYLLAGADILIMRHPEAVRMTLETIRRLMGGGGTQ